MQEDDAEANKIRSKNVKRAGRKMVSFIEQNPRSPTPTVTQAAEALAGQLVEDQVGVSANWLNTSFLGKHGVGA